MVVPIFSIVKHIWRRASVFLLGLLLPGILLVSCSGLSFGGGGSTNSGSSNHSGVTPTVAISAPTQKPLAQLHWCGKPVMIFRDEGAVVTAAATPGASSTPASTPKTVTDWAQVEPNLSFTIYLPAILPQSTCLISAIGTFHDPILGGSFIITYLLADHSSISLSEAPLRTQNSTLQCSPSTAPIQAPATPGPSANPTHVPVQLCTGARNTTNIVFSAQGDMAFLQQFFNALQPNIAWVPTS